MVRHSKGFLVGHHRFVASQARTLFPVGFLESVLTPTRLYPSIVLIPDRQLCMVHSTKLVPTRMVLACERLLLTLNVRPELALLRQIGRAHV